MVIVNNPEDLNKLRFFLLERNGVFFTFTLFRYRRRFAVDVEPLIDQMVDKAKVEDSEYRAAESQKQVSL